MNVVVLDCLSALQHFSKEELAYGELRAAILDNVLKPGERLIPQQLASRFDVSTMPVRQALMRLEAERLVWRLPNRGLMVAPLTVKEVGGIYTLRAVLEGLAARLAAPRLTGEELASLAQLVIDMEGFVAAGRVEELVASNAKFHFVIYRAADNEHMYDILKNLWGLSSRYRDMYYGKPGIPEDTLREHRGILAVLQQGDAARAEELVRADMEATARVLLAAVKDKISCNGGSVGGKVSLV
jgi:DNA-binding GntR family transcriptional regulator